MSINHRKLTLTTDSAGAGTATSLPISGLVYEIRVGGTALNNGGSADYTITRDDGGTILVLTNTDGPFAYNPRGISHSGVGAVTSAGTATAHIPVDGNVKVVVAQAAASASDTVTIYYGTR